MGTRTLRDQEGYTLIDHSNSPGIPDEIAVAFGMPVGSGRGVFEAPNFTCSHCQAVVIIAPNRRDAREYCRKCDHLICDRCAAVMHATGEHKTFKEHIDDVLTHAEKPRGPAPQLILP